MSAKTIEAQDVSFVDMAPQRRTIFGFTPLELSAVLAVFMLLGWIAWASYSLVELRQRRVVTVSLATIVKDFVASESRASSSPEVAAARTRAYLAATDAAIRSLSADGTTVLVSEAVVGNSVPDMTSAVAAAVNAELAKGSVPARAGEGGNGL